MSLPGKHLLISLLLAAVSPLVCLAQNGGGASPSTTGTLHSTSTLVLVPTLVTSPGAELVHGLQAEDFALIDNGVAQKLHVEEGLREPLAVVVLMQIGGSAPRQFQNYAGVCTMLDYALGSVPYWVSLVTFDSKPEDRWPFSRDVENLRKAFTSPKPGDRGAATLDAIEYGLDWFDNQHPRGRRIIVLISDEHFAHPAEQSQRIVRRLAETNTAIYSLNYSAETQWLKDQFTQERHGNPPLAFSPDHPAVIGTFDLKAPLMAALGGMQANAAGEMASLSGGVSLPFGNRKELEDQMMTFANDLANRYLLSFQPTSTSAGLHSVAVSIPMHPELRISSRAAYWRNAPAPQN